MKKMTELNKTIKKAFKLAIKKAYDDGISVSEIILWETLETKIVIKVVDFNGNIYYYKVLSSGEVFE